MLAGIATILGIVFLGFQIIDAKKDSRVKNSLDQLAALNQGEVSESSRRIATAMARYDFSQLPAGGVTRALIDDLIVDLQTEGGSEVENLDVAIMTVSLAIDGTLACVERGLCEASVVEPALREGYSNFHCLFASRLEALGKRMNTRNLAHRMRAFFSERPCG